MDERPPAKCCPSWMRTAALTWCRHRHLTKLFVREGLDTLGVPNCSSNICTSGWRLQPTVSVMTHTTPWGFVGVFGAPCAHHVPSVCLLEDCSERWATYFNVFSQQGTCTVAKRCPELRSPNLEWRCPPHSAAPRRYACFTGLVVSLPWLLPCSDLGLQFQYPSRAPGYIA